MSNQEVSYWDSIEAAFDRVSIYDGYKKFCKQMKHEPDHVRHLLCVHWTDSEISNGGYSQYFYNPIGMLALDAVNGYLAIGPNDLAGLMTKAIGRLGAAKFPADRKKRIKILETKGLESDGFRDLEEVYYRASENPDLGECMNRYAYSASQANA